MKNIILTFCILFMLSIQIQSQTTSDFLSRPGLSFGSVHYNWVDGTFNNSYHYLGDTLLCDENLLIYRYNYPLYNEILIRVEGGQVWRKSFNNPCDSGQLIYDFDLEVGDTTDALNYNGYNVVAVDTITLMNGEVRKHLFLTNNGNPIPVEWVDGIGSLSKGLFPDIDFEGGTSLVCVKENDETIWLNPNQSTELCDSISCFTPIPNFNFEVDVMQVNFNNLSVNQSSLIWDFGDGQTSTEINPIHNYDNPGCYTITLTLNSDCLSSAFVKKLSVAVCIANEWQVKTPDFTSSSINNSPFKPELNI